MKRSLLLLSLLSLSLLSSSTVAHADEQPPDAAKRPPPPKPQFVVKVTKVKLGPCSTDGGKEKCSAGVKFLAEVMPRLLNDWMESNPIACDAAGKATVKLGYEYNAGEFVVLDSDKAQAKWPKCVARFAAQAQPQLLGWWKKLFELDPLIDTRSEYTISLSLVKQQDE